MSVHLLTYNNLTKYADTVRHFTSTRQGGVSTGNFSSLNLGNFTDDDNLSIIKNRAILCEAVGISIEQLINAHQTHSTNVKVIDEAFMSLSLEQRKPLLNGFDAFITNLPNVCITVTTADCVPVLLFDLRNKAVAAIHSGWKSTLNNIVGITIDLMRKKYGTCATDLVAAVGACISKEKYEVGVELYEQFLSKGFPIQTLFYLKSNDKFLFDIRQAVHFQLRQQGVRNIEISEYCTYTHSDLFFSARRQGVASGRMLSGIFLKV
jgi:YfiH family protein